MTDQRAHIFVTGKVQGVFFRQAMKVMAIKNNVTGWVRNLADGRVEAVLEGNEADVRRLAQWSHDGPASSRVESVDILHEEFSGKFSKFDVLY